MPDPQNRQIPHVEVQDAKEAFRKLENFARRVLAVPKREVDAIAVQKIAKKKSKCH